VQDSLAAQRSTQQAVESLRAEIKAQVEAQGAAQQALQETCAEIKVWVAGQGAAQSEYNRALEKLRTEMHESQSAAQSNQSQALETLRGDMKDFEARGLGLEQRKEIDSLLAELAKELRERNDQIHEEQRVCFKQLSLESTEAAVLEDRSRRKTEKLVEELQRRLKQLEKKQS